MVLILTPKGKSDREIMKFCQSFMTELSKHIGADTDVPAGDIGTGAREIGYMFGQYKRLKNVYEGVLTGKGLTYGGSLARTEATGYGLLYLTKELLNLNGIDIAGKDCSGIGSGKCSNLRYSKAQELGVPAEKFSPVLILPVGYMIRMESMWLLKEVKEVKRARLTEYAKARPNVEYHEGRGATEHEPAY